MLPVFCCALPNYYTAVATPPVPHTTNQLSLAESHDFIIVGEPPGIRTPNLEIKSLPL